MTCLSLDTAMVMAAGLGRRMMPLTADRPKPLIPVLNTPLIDYTLAELTAGGVSRIIANVHYCADQVEAHFNAKTNLVSTKTGPLSTKAGPLSTKTGPTYFISDEREQLLETGGGLIKARPLIGEQPFFCANTDAIFSGVPTGNACALLREAWRAPMKALLLLVPLENTLGFEGNGDFHRHGDGRVTKAQGEAAPFAFTGLQILDPSLLNDMPDGPFSTRLIWQKAAKTEQLFGVLFDGHWLHVGTPQSVVEAESFLTAHSPIADRTS